MPPETLTEFLLARITEDEAADWRTCTECGSSTDRCQRARTTGAIKCCPDCRHPARVLAECEAKRRIVETHQHADYSFGNSQAECPTTPRPLADSLTLRDMPACDTLLLLAAVYAGHPNYRQEWKP